MGYTHYWAVDKLIPAAQWEALCVATRCIIACSEESVWFENDDPRPPQIDAEMIRFNGVGNDGHETFLLRPGIDDYGFCKTGRKPYDEIVVAVLLAAEEICPAFRWHSDGDAEDHADGLSLWRLARAQLNLLTELVA